MSIIKFAEEPKFSCQTHLLKNHNNSATFTFSLVSYLGYDFLIMRISRWEYHLTSEGWSGGSQVIGFKKKTRQIPQNRFLTIEWIETCNSLYITGFWLELWRAANNRKLRALQFKFGAMPNDKDDFPARKRCYPGRMLPTSLDKCNKVNLAWLEKIKAQRVD